MASPHHLASEAGAEVLRAGGTAADAAVAANAVLCVVYPHMTSVGGDLFALVWPAGGTQPEGLAGAGRSGASASVAAVRAQGHETMPETGALTVTVPGTVQAWGLLIERFGRMGLRPLLQPAAQLAREGWIVSPGLAAALASSAGWLLREPEAARLLPPLKAGMLLRNQDLADTLEEIGRNGWLPFYRGRIAEAIVAAVAGRGGFLGADDLALHRCEWVVPVAFPYRDLTVYELPPPTQGLAAAGLMRRLEAVPKAPGPE
ncbi:MAG: gamma-glutamyltransferase, partial [Candidatus Dormibacteraeota bacterium]|nr:gamma-glutamyltransferase [Candidatus Dormibacteraeota bacterium]